MVTDDQGGIHTTTLSPVGRNFCIFLNDRRSSQVKEKIFILYSEVVKYSETRRKNKKEKKGSREREKQKGEQILSRHFVDTKFDELGIEKY